MLNKSNEFWNDVNELLEEAGYTGTVETTDYTTGLKTDAPIQVVSYLIGTVLGNDNVDIIDVADMLNNLQVNKLLGSENFYH